MASLQHSPAREDQRHATRVYGIVKLLGHDFSQIGPPQGANYDLPYKKKAAVRIDERRDPGKTSRRGDIQCRRGGRGVT